MTARIAKVDTVILQAPKFSHFQFDGSFPERGRHGPRRQRPGRYRRMRFKAAESGRRDMNGRQLGGNSGHSATVGCVTVS